MDNQTKTASTFVLEKENISSFEALEYVMELCKAHNRLLLLDKVCMEYNNDPYSAFYFNTPFRKGRPYRLMRSVEASQFFRRLMREDQAVIYVSNNKLSNQLLFNHYGEQSLKLKDYRHNSPPLGTFNPSSLIAGISAEIRAWHNHPIEHKILLEKLEQEAAITRIYKAKAIAEEAKALHVINEITSKSLELQPELLEIVEVNPAILKTSLTKGQEQLTTNIKECVEPPLSIQTTLPNYIAVKGPPEVQAKLVYYKQIKNIYERSMEMEAKLNMQVKLDVKV